MPISRYRGFPVRYVSIVPRRFSPFLLLVSPSSERSPRNKEGSQRSEHLALGYELRRSLDTASSREQIKKRQSKRIAEKRTVSDGRARTLIEMPESHTLYSLQPKLPPTTFCTGQILSLSSSSPRSEADPSRCATTALFHCLMCSPTL